MRALISACVGLVAALGGCATSGPPELAACVSDSDVMAKFRAYPSDGKVLVGGVAKTGQVRCYWSDEHVAFVYFSAAWKACERDNNRDCTYLANHERIFFSGYKRPLVATAAQSSRAPATAPRTTSASGEVSPVVWYLIGKFVEGMAQGYVARQNQPPTSIPVVVAPPNRPSAPAISSRLRCSPRPMSLTLSGYPEYECR